MSSEFRKDRITLKGDISEKNWEDDWEKTIYQLRQDLKMIKGLPTELGSSADKFKKLIDFKERYDVEYVPPTLIRDIFAPEIEKLQNVHEEITEDSLLLISGDITIKFRAGYNNGVYCKDDSDYNFNNNEYPKPPETHQIIAENYKQYEDEIIDRDTFVKNMVNMMLNHHQLPDTKKNRLKYSIDVHRNLAKNPEIFKNVLKDIQRYELQVAENELIRVKNEERDERRREALIETKLLDLLKSLHKAGLKLGRDGMLEDDFYFKEEK